MTNFWYRKVAQLKKITSILGETECDWNLVHSKIVFFMLSMATLAWHMLKDGLLWLIGENFVFLSHLAIPGFSHWPVFVVWNGPNGVCSCSTLFCHTQLNLNRSQVSDSLYMYGRLHARTGSSLVTQVKPPHKSCIGIGSSLGFALVNIILAWIPVSAGYNKPRKYNTCITQWVQ